MLQRNALTRSDTEHVKDAIKASDLVNAFKILSPMWILWMFDVCIDLDESGDLDTLLGSWPSAAGLGEDRIKAAAYSAKVSRQKIASVNGAHLVEAKDNLLKIAGDQKDELLDKKLRRQPSGSGAEALVDALAPYSKAELKTRIENASDTADRITRWLSMRPVLSRRSIIADLEALQKDYQARLTANSKDAAAGKARAKTESALFPFYADVAMQQAPSKTPPAPSGMWAAGTAPAELLQDTKALSAAEQAAARQTLDPATASGRPAPTFVNVLPSGATYEWDLRVKVANWISSLYQAYVVGKGDVEHTQAAKLWDMPRFEELAQLAKDETHAVFGSYAYRDAFKGGTNLLDNWERQDNAIFGTKTAAGTRVNPKSGPDKRAQAEALLYYAMSEDEDLLAVHDAHGAMLTRSPEKDIIEKVVKSVAAVEELRLLHIDRGWDAEADPPNARIMIQLWKVTAPPGKSADLGNRAMFWDKFKTLVHEYLHTLAHTAYRTRANQFAYLSSERNMLIEGVDSVLMDVVWSRILTHVGTLRAVVEKPYAAQPYDPRIIPRLRHGAYPSFNQAMSLVQVVGLQNLYAAYFLGRIDLIGL